MERRVTTRRGGAPGGGRRAASLRTSLLLVAGAAFVGAGGLAAQDPPDPDRCRCVDASGNRIENCTCMVLPDRDVLTRVWSLNFQNRARIGVTVSGEQPAGADRAGARVEGVLEGGPADEAGIRAGDVIVRVDGRSLFDPLVDPEAEEALALDESVAVQRLLAMLRELEPGDEVEIEYVRNGETRRAVVEAEANPDRRFHVLSDSVRLLADSARLFFDRRGGAPGVDFRGLVVPGGERARRFSFPEGTMWFHADSLRSFENRDFGALLPGRTDPCLTGTFGGGRSFLMLGGNCVEGLELTAVNPELGEYFGTDRGLLVTEVREGTTLGLQSGDVLLAVDGREVEDVSHLRRILDSYEPDEELTLSIMRKGEATEVTGRRR